jgi:predicted regulator of Ras-like GTPase activity (Roadblock/LC7/MglB family)
MTGKKKGVQLGDQDTEDIAVQVNASEKDLREKLDEIRGHEGVIGYILRNTHTASIDVKDPTRIIDYAILSSSAIDASDELSDLFDVGDIKSVVVEGKNIKMLSMAIDENRISIFTDKSVDLEAIRKTLYTDRP